MFSGRSRQPEGRLPFRDVYGYLDSLTSAYLNPCHTCTKYSDVYVASAPIPKYRLDASANAISRDGDSHGSRRNVDQQSSPSPRRGWQGEGQTCGSYIKTKPPASILHRLRFLCSFQNNWTPPTRGGNHSASPRSSTVNRTELEYTYPMEHGCRSGFVATLLNLDPYIKTGEDSAELMFWSKPKCTEVYFSTSRTALVHKASNKSTDCAKDRVGFVFRPGSLLSTHPSLPGPCVDLIEGHALDLKREDLSNLPHKR